MASLFFKRDLANEYRNSYKQTFVPVERIDHLTSRYSDLYHLIIETLPFEYRICVSYVDRYCVVKQDFC